MGKIFKRGLIAVAPITITLALIFWIFNFLENIFGTPIKALIGEQHYFTGLGILVALLLITLIGSFINSLIIQKISKLGESIVRKIPLVKTLYNSVGELMTYFGSKESQKTGQVVMVNFKEHKILGLVTRESFEGLPAGMGDEEHIAVFIPMSYQIGGYTIAVLRSQVTRINMTVEEAMRYAVTAGVLTTNKKVENYLP